MSNKLTPREVEILNLIARGRLNKQVAFELCISEVGVKSHLVNIRKKLHTWNRTDAVIKAHKLGYLNLMECK